LDLAEPGFGASMNVDGKGCVLGVEFLSLKEYTELITRFGSVLELPDEIETLRISLPTGTLLRRDMRTKKGRNTLTRSR